MKYLLLFFSCLCFGAHADWYVATNGNNAAAGTLGAPWRDIRYGVLNMTAGETLFIRGGTYSDDGFQIEEFKSGPATNQPTIIQSYPGEWAVYYPSVTVPFHGMIISGKSNIVLNGFEIDARNMTSDGIKLDQGTLNVTITNVTVRGCKTGMGILTTGVNEGDLMNSLITHCRLITNGWFQTDPDSHSDLHQIYIQTSGMKVENCYVVGATNSRGWTLGIHYFGGDCTNAIFRNNFFTNCAIGILASASRGSNCWIYNNIAQHCFGNAVKVDQMNHVYVQNNTSWSNTSSGFHITRSTNIWVESNIAANGVARGIVLDSNSDFIQVNNNLAYTNEWLNPASDFADFKLDNAHNVTTNANLFNIIEINGDKTSSFTPTYDAKFVDVSVSNFRVLAGSSAIGNGKAQSIFNTDFGGNLRSLPWTIGAWQFLPANSVNIITARIGTGIILGP